MEMRVRMLLKNTAATLLMCADTAIIIMQFVNGGNQI